MTEAPRPAGAALTELSDEALSSLVAEHGGKAFQARQLAHWVFRHGAADWAGCRNVPAGLKQRLDDAGFCVRSSRVIHVEPSSDGTEKLLLELADGETVETVLIPEG